MYNKNNYQKGSKALKWLQGRRTVISIYEWKIVFEAVVGNEYKSEMAIDDIISTPGECVPSKVCDFDHDLCDFKNVD
jgi:hypothetical protein